MSPAARVDKMGVDNVGFLIENLGADAAPLQYLRELVQNEIEAIRAAGITNGQVVIDWEEVKGVRKLRISGNGPGMTPEDVKQYINHLSATSGIQAFDKNFGIGAKITAGARNPHGVMYKAWKDGVGSLTILGLSDGEYGRLPFSDEDGRVDYWYPQTDEDKPRDGAGKSIIDKHGVAVVLLGQSDEDDTTMAPPDADLPSQWVAAYLERRYFRLPAYASVSVVRPRAILDSERGHRTISDTIRGQGYYLDQHSMASGKRVLPDAHATVWWWLLNEEITKGGKTWNNRGHVAAIYQDELHEIRAGHARTSALQDFGIYAGFGRIIIYVEPDNVLKPNTARTSLILRGNVPVDYVAIGEAFVAKMPTELEAFMAGQVSTEPGEHRKAIQRALQEVDDALNDARFKRSRRGSVGSYDAENGGEPAPTFASSPRREQPERRKTDDAAGRVGSEYLRKAREERERRLRAQPVDADPAPKVVWDNEGTVQAGRAATYTRGLHVVTASPRFQLYMDFVEWGIREAKARGTAEIEETALRSIVEDEVRRWFAQAFSETVVVMRPLEYDSTWGPSVYDNALSDEGLTAAVVSHRWHMMTAIKRGLSGRLGRVKDPATPQPVAN